MKNEAFSSALQQVRETGGVGDKPLAVVIGTGSENSQGVLRSLQESHLQLSTISKLYLVEGATHSGLVDDERYAGETGKAILAVVEAVRTGEMLGK